MSNMNVILSANLQVQDITGGGSQQIINRNIGNPTYAATTVFYDPFFQATTSGVEVPLPVDAYVAYVKNLDPAAVITITYQNLGSATNHTLTLSPGGVWMIYNVAQTAGTGIQALSIAGVGATVSCCVLVSQ
jgi:hypothetical protein